MAAINSNNQGSIINNRIGKNMEKASSGLRINRAGDDAAGLAISEKMKAVIKGLNMASKNSQDAISLLQVAEGGMQSIQDMFQRMRELAVQASSDTNSETDRGALNSEVQQIIGEVDNTAATTEFNEIKLLDGSLDGMDNSGATPVPDPDKSLTIQTGANEGQTTSINIAGMDAERLLITENDSGVYAGRSLDDVSVETRDDANDVLAATDSAINSISMQRAELGAMQNRLEFRMNNLNIAAENQAAAESRVRDTDMAQIMTELVKNKILQNASNSVSAHANLMPQNVLRLIG